MFRDVIKRFIPPNSDDFGGTDEKYPGQQRLRLHRVCVSRGSLDFLRPVPETPNDEDGEPEANAPKMARLRH